MGSQKLVSGRYSGQLNAKPHGKTLEHNRATIDIHPLYHKIFLLFVNSTHSSHYATAVLVISTRSKDEIQFTVWKKQLLFYWVHLHRSIFVQKYYMHTQKMMDDISEYLAYRYIH